MPQLSSILLPRDPSLDVMKYMYIHLKAIDKVTLQRSAVKVRSFQSEVHGKLTCYKNVQPTPKEVGSKDIISITSHAGQSK